MAEAPAVTAPSGTQTPVTYSASPSTVCGVDSVTGELTIAGAGTCTIMATAAGNAHYKEASVTFDVVVQPLGTLTLNVGAIAEDDTVNAQERAGGFAIGGDTGTESGVSVEVGIGTATLSATSDTTGAWSVSVPANATYITEPSVSVSVTAAKIGFAEALRVDRTLAVVLAPPAVVTNIQVVVAEASYVLTWDDPGDDSITKYQYRLSSGGSWSEWTDIPESGSDTKSYTVTAAEANLDPNTQYRCQVRGVNAGGFGAEPTPEDTPTAPELNAPPDFGAAAAMRAIGEQSPAGSAVGAPVAATDANGDSVTYSLSGDGAGLFAVDAMGQIAVAHGAELDYEAQPRYVVTVIASDDKGGMASIAVTIEISDVGAPGAPSGLSATAGRQPVISLAWTAPAPAPDRAAVRGYRVEWSSDGNAPWAAITPDLGASASRYEHTGLETGTTRHYRVIALSSEGESPASNIASATTVGLSPALMESLEVMLAVTARSVAESAQTAIESRFDRMRHMMRARQSGQSGGVAGEFGAQNDMALWSPMGSGNSPGGVDASGGAHPALTSGRYAVTPTPANYVDNPLEGIFTAGPEPATRESSSVQTQFLPKASFNLALRESDAGGGLVLWGQGDLQRFDGDITRSGMNYRGDLNTAHIGLDYYANEELLVGLSFMRSWGDMEYTRDGTEGMLENRLNTVHPYVYWQPNECVSVWGIGGLGRGDVEFTEPNRSHAVNADFGMFLGGVRSVLSSPGNMEFGLRADVFAARLGTNASEDISATITGDVSRARVMLEVVREMSMAAGQSLSVKVEIGGRYDGGDADRGAGAEAGFRFGFLDAGAGLDVALHGRVLLVHESDYENWGLGVQASWDPGQRHKGLRLSVASSVGQQWGERTMLWDKAAFSALPMEAGYMVSTRARIDSELAYGMEAFGGRGLLRPYGRAQLAGQGRELSVGAELSLLSGSPSSTPMKFAFEGIKREGTSGQAGLGVTARITIPF